MTELARVSERERIYVEQVLDSAFRSSSGATMGTRLERAFAGLVLADFAIAFVNGTATLHAALAAAGVGPGDEVIVPPLTMASTTLAVQQAGAVPVFADVDRDTFVIDPASVAERITSRTRAIMPVALYGLPPDLTALAKLAGAHGLTLIEDDAQAFLARIDGRPIGAIGDAGSFSFQSSKQLTSGEGGILTTNDSELAEAIRRFNSLGYAAVGAQKGAISREQIQDPGYSRHVGFGFNYRMPELCAAVALAQVERADELIEFRVKVAQLFREAVGTCDWLVAQRTPSGRVNTYWTLALRLDHPNVSWHDFRRVFLSHGGDPFYGAWKLTYLEPLFAAGCPVRHPSYEGSYQRYGPGLCPTAEEIQPRLIQLKTNYWEWDTAQLQAEALANTVKSLERGVIQDNAREHRSPASG
jgi:perosamine synthetase